MAEMVKRAKRRRFRSAIDSHDRSVGGGGRCPRQGHQELPPQTVSVDTSTGV